MTMESRPLGQETGKRFRRRHQKSRDGCLECKRRRKKCDEVKPSCTRCVSALIRCMYQEALYAPGSPSSPIRPLPSAQSAPDRFPLLSLPGPSHGNTDEHSAIELVPEAPSETDLCHHYLQHMNPDLGLYRSDCRSSHFGMEMLAQQSDIVLHSLLAVSAVSLAWNMMSRTPLSETESVYQTLLSGYQHHNEATKRMRESISKLGSSNPDFLVTSTLILLRFAAASQQINHWISSRGGAHISSGYLTSTPRDVIIFIRGVRTMLETLLPNSSVTNCDPSVQMSLSASASPVASLLSNGPGSPKSHSMTNLIDTTSRDAFSELQKRLGSLISSGTDQLDCDVLACLTAFEVLEKIRSSTFDITTLPQLCCLQADGISSAHMAPWLHSFVNRPCVIEGAILLPTEPLTRLLLSFLAQVSQDYLDLVLPLLDQRLESPVNASLGCSISELTQTQALALDIYAHWSVLMFLVEEESWWIGTLPTVTLTGMVNRYGAQFVGKLWPGSGISTQWWPGIMLRTLQDIKKCK